MSLKYSVVPVREIGDALKKTMFSLFRQYYADVDFHRFSVDLSEKTSVIMLWDRSKSTTSMTSTGSAISTAPYLFGFSTVLVREVPEGGRIVYSGDTVVDSDYWGSRTLQSAFSRVLFQTRLRHPFSPLYWMLISKGFKTYMLMRRNFKVSFPNTHGVATPELLKIKNDFYKGKFGDHYDAETSIIDFGSSIGRVKDQVAMPSEKDRMNPEVKFFLAKNPRYHQGVELACIANIRWVDIGHIIFKYAFPFMKRLPLPHYVLRFLSR